VPHRASATKREHGRKDTREQGRETRIYNYNTLLTSPILSRILRHSVYSKEATQKKRTRGLPPPLVTFVALESVCKEFHRVVAVGQDFVRAIILALYSKLQQAENLIFHPILTYLHI